MTGPPWTTLPDPPLPMISMAAVIEALVLQPPFARVALTEPNMSGFMQYFSDFASLGIDTVLDGVPHKLAVNIMFSSTTAVTRPYFRCPSCKMPRDFLVYDNKLICTEDYIKSGSGRSKNWRRLRVRDARGLLTLIARRKQSQWIPREQWQDGVRFSDRYLPAARAAEKAAQAAPSPRPHAAPFKALSPYSTEQGLILGRGAGEYDAFFDYLRSGDAIVSDLRKSRPITLRPAKPAAMSKTPVLDIKALGRNDRWPTEENPLSAFTLHWPDDMNPLIVIDARSSKPFLVVSDDWIEAERRWQLLEVTLQADGRRRFTCPVNGRTCDQLYLRDGVFASREAHRLFHDSQRGAGRSRAKKQSVS